MANQLADLLIKLSGDLDLQHKYATNPEAVMTQYGLSANEKAALRAGNEGAIFSTMDSPTDWGIAKLILAFKLNVKT